jgi:ribosome biogenesis GTPase
VTGSAAARPAGTVLGAVGGVYTVRLDDGSTIDAVLRGRLKQEQRTGDRVVAGDRVEVELHDGGGTIEVVHERRTELARRAPGHGGRRAKVIVANVDQVVLVFAAAEPAPRARMLDRLLVLAESNDLPGRIVLNKIDLVAPAEADAFLAPYEAAGYDTLRTSVVGNTGIDTLRVWLAGRDSVLTGPSGAGKSSLLNAAIPGIDLRVGAVSQAVRKGRHTTVSARIVPLPGGGWVADTPGLREVGLWRIDAATLGLRFPEFRPFARDCRFGTGCTHTHEPCCAVRDAVDAGSISRERWESYVAMRQED